MNPSKVRRIATLINNLPMVSRYAACSESGNPGPPSIWFVFRARPRSRELAEVSGWDSTRWLWADCLWMRFSVRDHKPRSLVGGGYLIARAEKILGQKLK
jgi:hypothetical protein